MQKAHPEAYAARDAAAAAAAAGDVATPVAAPAASGGGVPAWVWVAGAVAIGVIWWLSR